MQEISAKKVRTAISVGLAVAGISLLTAAFGPRYFGFVNKKAFPPQGQFFEPPSQRFAPKPPQAEGIRK